MQTLKSFLESIALSQYYEAFIKAGATDQDLPQLVAFSEEELCEFLSALDMLPFHSIKFKRSLRELKLGSSNQDDLTLIPSTREFIVSHATIYGKKKNRSLTSYEEAINNAALELALKDPVLISKKGSLFDLAKKRLLENGYHYKRGSSRSKLKHKVQIKSSAGMDEQQQLDILARRQENAQRMSDQRVEKIELLQTQVEYALQSRQIIENQLVTASLSSAIRLDMQSELVRFEDTKVKLTKEISKLKAQERKHQWYKRRKVERGSQSTDEGFSSQTSQEDERHSAFSVCIPTMTESTILTCSRESDVRASSMSEYDR